MTGYQLDELGVLEAEAIYVMREAASQCDRPVLLFSGGKDSTVLLRLAQKAFHPSRIPFPVMHIDTGHNFPEVVAFRDQYLKELDQTLIVRSVQESIDRGRVRDEQGPRATRNRLQTVTLLDAIAEHRFDCVFGGGRRDEDRARAKERIFSVRNTFGEWDPQNQRPELWSLYNAHVRPGEHVRVFPLSNWTEIDVWGYIARERLAIPALYFAHVRDVFERDGMLLAEGPFVDPEGAPIQSLEVRFRTVGDMTCTAAVRSSARNVIAVIEELRQTPTSERGATRVDDHYSEAGMEDRKRAGYF